MVPVEDALVHEESGRAGADLSLVQGEQHGALDGLVQVGIIVVLEHIHTGCYYMHNVYLEAFETHHDGREEDEGRLASQLHGHGHQVVAGSLHDQRARRGLTSERHLR